MTADKRSARDAVVVLLIVHINDAASILALCVADEVVVLKMVHVVEASRHVLLILRTDSAHARRVHTLRVVISLLLLRLLEFVVESLELVGLLVHSIASGCRGGTLIVMTTVLEHVCLVLRAKCFLSDRSFRAKSV